MLRLKITFLLFTTLCFSALQIQASESEGSMTEEQWQTYLDNLKPEKSKIKEYSVLYFVDVAPVNQKEFEQLVTNFGIEGAKLAKHTPAKLYRLKTGEYSHLIIFPMENPAASFAFEQSEADVEFMRALSSKYSAAEIQNAYSRYAEILGRSNSIIVGKVAPY
ncbi:MAG: hypothetical protein VXZ36_15525 [Pseudomonadota bacterium]|nr:hypothetical protein [Pseudomonadota bacterium]